MDTSSGNYPPNLIGTVLTGVKPSLDNPRTPSASLSLPTGLARYHSAPTSMLASLLEPDVYMPSHGSDLLYQYLAHGGLAEFTSVGFSLKPNNKEQYLAHGSFAEFSSVGLSLKSNNKEHQSSASSQGHNREDYPIGNDIVGRQRSPYMVVNTRSGCFQEHIGPGPLSAILEHGGEDTMVSRPLQQSPRERAAPMLAPPCLIRHSSMPVDTQSRLVTDDVSDESFSQHVSEGPFTQHVGPHVQTPPRLLRGDDNTGGKVFVVSSSVSPRALPVTKSYVEANQADVCNMSRDELSMKHGGLLRQSSSPAGMLSQLSLDEASSGSEKVKLLSPMGRSCAQGLVHGAGSGEWDEDALDSAIGQRKRGRNGVARLYKDNLLMGSVDSCAISNLYPAMSAGNAEGLLADSVLCKSRAKRGCATHPRSIAERVRRTKISERIKKLQELVPNLDKQAHMADMLDEVVEYVKLLQKQVQELSRHAPECNGMCQKVESRGTIEM